MGLKKLEGKIGNNELARFFCSVFILNLPLHLQIAIKTNKSRQAAAFICFFISMKNLPVK